MRFQDGERRSPLQGKKVQTLFSWIYDVSKCAPPEALYNLDNAFAQFFRRVKERRAGKKVKDGFPEVKAQKKGVESFRGTSPLGVFKSISCRLNSDISTFMIASARR
jgi:hypothetical protein